MHEASKLPNKRLILQPILDAIEPGWTIMKPTPLNPTDVDTLCIFQKPADYKQEQVAIDNSYFEDVGERHKIRPLVEAAIRNAKQK